MPQREPVEPHKGDKRDVLREEAARFSGSDELPPSLPQDMERKATAAKPENQGEKRD